MQDTEKILGKIGLTNQETRTYLALLELKAAQAGYICNKTKIATPNLYPVLDKLLEKGLISYRIQNNIKVFMPSPPEILNNLFLEKQKELEKEKKDIQFLINNLKECEPNKETYSNYKYYENISGIKSMWHEINNIMDSSITIKAHACKKEAYDPLTGFYTEHHKLRKEKKVKMKLILPKEDLKIAIKRKNKLTEVKLKKLDNEAEWGVMGDYFFMQNIKSKNPRGFLIRDKSFAQTFEQLFDEIWNNLK